MSRASIVRSRSFFRALLGSLILALAAVLCLATPASADFAQQGEKLVGANIADGTANQGWSVALSANGDTMLVGAPSDGSGAGAVWVYGRNGRQWIERAKMVANDTPDSRQFGFSVAMSSDGNTAAIGAPQEAGSSGAIYIFVRVSGVWSQQAKLIGSLRTVFSGQGVAVALSADGNGVAFGGAGDNQGRGAVWHFTRSGTTWSQVGPKIEGQAAGEAFGYSVALSAAGNTMLVGAPNGGSGGAYALTLSNGVWSLQGGKLAGTSNGGSQGRAVALSADGNTALISDSSHIPAGAGTIFARANGAWTQQATLVPGSDVLGNASAGHAVALSADGNLAALGGPHDNDAYGAAWIYGRNGATWALAGSKLVGAGGRNSANYAVRVGSALAFSGDGKTLAAGGPYDTFQRGATWVFTQRQFEVASHDVGADAKSDLLWRDANGNLALWQMNGASVASNTPLGQVSPNWSIIGQRDFHNDGYSDVLWRDASGGVSNVAMWRMQDGLVSAVHMLGYAPAGWSIVSTADFNSDGKGDILWRSESGSLALWLMDGASATLVRNIGVVPPNWSIAASGDFDGDGKADLLWRDTSGNIALWLMNGGAIKQTVSLGALGTAWVPVGMCDFNGDGKGDILWRETGSGGVAIWLMNGGAVQQIGWLGAVPPAWAIATTGDLDGDGKSDLVWRNTTTGATVAWTMNGAAATSIVDYGLVPTEWTIQTANAQ